MLQQQGPVSWDAAGQLALSIASGGTSEPNVDPSHIMQVGMGFWASKTVLSAVELELFTQLGSEAMNGEERVTNRPPAPGIEVVRGARGVGE